MAERHRPSPEADDARAKSVPAGKLNRPVEYARIWKGLGIERWDPDRRWWEQEVYSDHEARILSVIIAESTWETPCVRRPVRYLASKGRMSVRSANRALAVLCNEKNGVLKKTEGRMKADGGGRFEINGYEPVLERLAEVAQLTARPDQWDGPARNKCSNTATVARGTIHVDRVRAAIAAAGLSLEDPTSVIVIHLAERADRADYWLARAESNAELRNAARDKRAKAAAELRADVDNFVAGLAKYPTHDPARAALPLPVVAAPVLPKPPTTAPSVTTAIATPAMAVAKPPLATLTMEELLARRPGDALLSVIARWQKAGYGWAGSAQDHILRRGGRITDAEKETARELLAREARGEPPGGWRATASGAPGNLQPAGKHRPRGA